MLKNSVLVDIRSICKRPVGQIPTLFAFRNSDFEKVIRDDEYWRHEEDWSLKQQVAAKYGLESLHISIEQNKFRSRSNWFEYQRFDEPDTQASEKNWRREICVEVSKYETLTLQHEGSDSNGVVASCFDHRPGH